MHLVRALAETSVHLNLGGGIWRKLTDAEVIRLFGSPLAERKNDLLSLFSRKIQAAWKWLVARFWPLDWAVSLPMVCYAFGAISDVCQRKPRDSLNKSKFQATCFSEVTVTLDLPQRSHETRSGVAFIMARKLAMSHFH